MKTVRDVAMALHVSEEHVRKWIRTGKLNAFKSDGWRIKDEDFMLFLADNPKYERLYFIEVFGHKPPVRISKKTERILIEEKQEKQEKQYRRGLKQLIQDIELCRE